jgi:outer membrane receptor protein involved in Fe transport
VSYQPTTFISLFVFVSIFWTTTIFGQSYVVNGKVVDQDNHSVEFVSAYLQGIGGISSDKVVSDDKGIFSIKADRGKYTLILEKFGNKFYSSDIDLNQNLNLGVIKVEQAVALEGVTIKGNRRVIERKFDKLIFNVDNSPLKQGYSGLELLKRSPGLRVNSQGNILLRNENVLVTVNGRKMNFSSEELGNYLSSLNSENIKSIEIQNLGSAETDASNTGGVVNIVLKKVPTGFQSTIKTSYAYRDDQHAAYTGGITNQFGSEKWSIYNKINYNDNSNLSTFNSLTNFFDTNGRNANFGQSDNRNKNFNTTTGFVFRPSLQHEVGAEIYYSNSKVHRDGWENLTVYNPALNAISDNYSLYQNKNKFWNAVLNYTWKLNENGSNLKFIGDIGNTELNNNNEVDTKYSFGSLTDNYNKFLTDASSSFFNLQTDWLQKFDKEWEMTLGAKYASVNRDNLLNVFLNENGIWAPSSGNQNFNNDEKVLANYLSVSKQWSKKHSLKVGLRTEYTNISGIDYANNTTVKRRYFDWFPNVYYNYTLKDDQNLAISYSRRITRPSFRDLNPFVIKQNDFLYQKGNPNLQPQYTDKVDVSYNIKNHTFSLFGNFSNDLIVGVYSADNNVTTYRPENFGKSQTVGFSYSYYGDITKWLFASVSSGFWYYNFDINHRQYNRWSYYNTISLQVKFSKKFFLDITNDYTSRSQNSVTEYFYQYGLDLALQKSFFQNAATLRLSMDDIFNTQRDKNISRYETFDFSFYQKRITRYPTLTFTYNIKSKNKVNTKNVQKGNDNINRL